MQRFLQFAALLIFAAFLPSDGCSTENRVFSGYLYASDMVAFISEARLTQTARQLIITYPKYECPNVDYNVQNFPADTLRRECAELNTYLRDRNITVPKTGCTDTYEYTVTENQYKIEHSGQQSCYGFSPHLNIMVRQADGLLIQFQTEEGLFQGEFTLMTP